MPATAIFDQIRTGDFLDRARVRRIAVIYLIIAVISLVALIATSNGFTDRMGRPLGADFMAFHVAGAVALKEGPAAAYDGQRLYAEHQELLEDEAPPFWPFLYPPAFLFVAIGLAAFPYLAGWLAWMGATLGAYLWAMQKVAPGKYAALLAMALPAVYSNFIHGQNGFLIAALFGAGLHSLFAGRSIFAGIALGLIAIKPQYGLLIPIALAAGGFWRAFAAAAAVVVLQVAIPAAVFGADIWTAFFEIVRAARREIVEAGAIGFEKIQSVFAATRFIGAPVEVAYGLQAAVFAAAAYFTTRLWRGGASPDVKGAGLVIAAVLATPYVVDYDLVILAPAMAMLAREGLKGGFLPFEKVVLLITAFAPVLARPVGAATHLSIGLLAMIALYAMALRRAR